MVDRTGYMGPALRYGLPTAALLILLMLGACAGVSPEAAFDEVEAELEARGIRHVHWYTGTEEDEEVAETVRQLLDKELTADIAVQVTLLNNRRLQSIYASLGVAQADLVQAGLLGNPILNAEMLFPLNGGSAELELGLAQSFLEIFYIPLRRNVAGSLLEETKLTVAGSVLDFEHQARTRFHAVQAAFQTAEMFRHFELAADLRHDLARRLRGAGNITELEFHEHRAHLEQARVHLLRAKADHFASRERLNRTMGLFGEDVDWELSGGLPEIPEDVVDVTDIENRAVNTSLDLAIARQRIITAGRLLGLDERTALFPTMTLGTEAEREDGDWAVGPTLSLPIPFLDRGQARIARTRSELRRQQDEYRALAVEIRSMARVARTDIEEARQIAEHYREVILPLRRRITGEAQLQYHAMDIGIFDLLSARERQIEAEGRYVESLHRYWTSRAVLDQLMRGRAPSADGNFSGDD